MRSTETTERVSAMEVAKAFVVPLLVAIVVGAGSSWVAIQVTTARMQEQLDAQEIAIAKLEDKQARVMEIQRANDRDLVDRLARIETQLRHLNSLQGAP